MLPQVEATGEQVPNPITSFEDADLPPALAANTVRCNYTKPTPVQKYSIPIGLAHRDLMACAQTGSGKTAAFCFPIIANILKSNVAPLGRSRKAHPMALVLSPTRELSSQIYDEARKFTYQTGIRPVVVYGGAPVMNQVLLLPRCLLSTHLAACACLLPSVMIAAACHDLTVTECSCGRWSAAATSWWRLLGG